MSEASLKKGAGLFFTYRGTRYIYINHRSPRRGTGFASDTKTLTEGGPCPESITSPCQRLARGLGSGLKPLLKDKKGLGLLVTLQGGTLQKKDFF